LEYIEGLRAIAVLLVVLDHVFRSTLVFWPYAGWKAMARDGLNWVSNGRASLAFFIVLSGYLLMRGVLENGGKMRGGLAGYVRRRAGRLLPGYFAAFAGSILAIRWLPALQRPLSVEWRDALPVVGPGSGKMILSHLLLVQNFSYRWAFKGDPPIWTVATQGQIYLLMPLLLLPIWRRIGISGTVAAALALGLGGFLATGKGHAAAPWFLGLFTLGMAAAQREGTHHGYERRFYGWLASILFAAYAGVTLAFSYRCYRFITISGWEGVGAHWLFDCWVGLATACLLIFASSAREHWLVRLLSRRWLVGIGAISYSVYLIHDPILAMMKIPLDRAGLGQFEQFGCYLGVGVPILLLLGWVFYRLFEKPFRGRKLTA
jgi:peptidoglycan/LPS O-acetylase OafA/YrhL